jgi:hypothetical protein
VLVLDDAAQNYPPPGKPLGRAAASASPHREGQAE